LIEAGEKVCAVSLPFEWVDIGCVADFWAATRLILEGKVKGFKVPGSEIRPGVHAGLAVHIAENVVIKGPVYIGSGTTIEAGVRIEGPAVIGANCLLRSGAHIHEGILGDYTRVCADALLDRRIVFAGKYIEPSGEALDMNEHDLGWLIDDVRKPEPAAPQLDELRAAMRSAAAIAIAP
jgi:mannose-1-phosphate guanylyltransferase